MKEQLLKDILDYFDISIGQFESTVRKKEVVRARQVYFYVRHLNGGNVNNIAHECGFDHSTVSYAVKKIKEQVEVNDEINNLVTKLFRKYRNEIQGS